MRGGSNNEPRGYWPAAAGSPIGVWVAELASSYDLQVEVQQLGDVGETLVLTATRQVDRPD